METKKFKLQEAIMLNYFFKTDIIMDESKFNYDEFIEKLQDDVAVYLKNMFFFKIGEKYICLFYFDNNLIKELVNYYFSYTNIKIEDILKIYDITKEVTNKNLKYLQYFDSDIARAIAEKLAYRIVKLVF